MDVLYEEVRVLPNPPFFLFSCTSRDHLPGRSLSAEGGAKVSIINIQFNPSPAGRTAKMENVIPATPQQIAAIWHL